MTQRHFYHRIHQCNYCVQVITLLVMVSAEKRRSNQKRITKENVTEKLSTGVCAKLKEPQGKAKLPWDQPQLELIMTPGPNGLLEGKVTRTQ